MNAKSRCGAPATTNYRRILMLGLGNPLMGDDGVGWRVAKLVQREIEKTATAIEIDCLAVGGLSLMERLTGYDYVVVVDAVASGKCPPGTIYRLCVDDLTNPGAGHCNSVHDMTLQTALQLGRALDLPLPEEILIVGVETEQTFDFANELSPPVAAAVPHAANLVIELLRNASEKDQQS